MQRRPCLSADDHDVFGAILVSLLPGGTAELAPGEAVRIDLVGQFLREDGDDVVWDQVEEAQMTARLDGLPDEYWATLRESGPSGTLYFDVLRFDA